MRPLYNLGSWFVAEPQQLVLFHLTENEKLSQLRRNADYHAENVDCAVPRQG